MSDRELAEGKQRPRADAVEVKLNHVCALLRRRRRPNEREGAREIAAAISSLEAEITRRLEALVGVPSGTRPRSPRRG